MEAKKKLTVVIDQCNKNMIRVDECDQLNSFPDNSQKCLKWFVIGGLELILDSSMSKVYILAKKKTHRIKEQLQNLGKKFLREN